MIRRGLGTVAIVLSFVNLIDASDKDELLAAAKKGDVAAVKALIANGADVNAKTAYGVTPLLHAASQGHTEVVKLLLEHKADANAKDTFYGQTPLLASLDDKSNVETVRLLIEAGAKDTDAALRTAA